MADENDNKKSGFRATPAVLAFSAILAAAPTIGFAQALAEHGQNLTDEQRVVLSSLSRDEVTALSSINTQLDNVRLPAKNNNNNNNNKKQ